MLSFIMQKAASYSAFIFPTNPAQGFLFSLKRAFFLFDGMELVRVVIIFHRLAFRSSGRRNPSASRTTGSERRQNGDRERTAEPMSPPPPEINGHITIEVPPPPPANNQPPPRPTISSPTPPAVQQHGTASAATKEEERPPQQSYLGGLVLFIVFTVFACFFIFQKRDENSGRLTQQSPVSVSYYVYVVLIVKGKASRELGSQTLYTIQYTPCGLISITISYNSGLLTWTQQFEKCHKSAHVKCKKVCTEMSTKSIVRFMFRFFFFLGLLSAALFSQVKA
jgi:hypothetical protein